MSEGKLYVAYGTRASKVLWLAKALAVDLQVVVISLQRGEQKAAAYLEKNPHGSVPTLELPDGQCLWESGAIIYYLLEKFDPQHALTGPVGSKARNTFHNFNALAAETEEVVIPFFLHSISALPHKFTDEVAANCKKKWDEKLRAFYHLLLKNTTGFANGTDQFSALDVVVGYSLNLASRGGLLAEDILLQSYVDRIQQHPHFGPSHKETQ